MKRRHIIFAMFFVVLLSLSFTALAGESFEKDGFTVVDGVLTSYTGSETEITIPDGVTEIGSKAFYSNTSLTSVTIPEGVTAIGDSAFRYCKEMTSVTIPEGVTSIGLYAFNGCSKLSSICVPSIQYWLSIDHNNTDLYLQTSGNLYVDGETVSSVTIPEGITAIGDYTFRNCIGLTSVTIPEDVTSIGTYAFNGCSKLSSICVPSIQYWLSIDHNNTDLFLHSSGNLYVDGKTVSSVTIPEGVTTIGIYAFRNCSGLISVTIPEGITTIGDYAFRNCKAMTSVTIPEGVTSIGTSAFNGCSKLSSICVPSIQYWLSIDHNNTDLYLQASGNLYVDGETVSSVTIPEGITAIGDYAFYNCSSLQNVTIPEGVTSIGMGAFDGCSNLTNVTIPESVTSIEIWAFGSCSNLTRVKISGSITTIGNCAFSACYKISNIYVPSIQYWLSVDHNKTNLYLQTCGNLYVNGKIITSITIPEDVTAIGDYTFHNLVSLTSVTIPESVTSIGDYAFYNCSSLLNVTIPKNVMTIGDYAFFNCSSLKCVSIPQGVKTIEKFVFTGCSCLTSVSIPGSVASMDAYIFYNCRKLTSVTFEEGITALPNDIFSDCSSLNAIYLPESMTTFGNPYFSTIPLIYCHEYSAANTWATTNYPAYVRYYEDGDDPVSITVSGKDEMETGETYPFTAEVFPSFAGTAISWSSTDPAILSVDQNGLVTGLSAGTASVTATVGSVSGTYEVKVIQAMNDFTVTPSEVWLVAKETVQLSVSTDPAGCEHAFTWSSSDTTYATVSDTGLVTTKGIADTTITCKASNGMQRECIVHATYPVSSIAFDSETISMSIGDKVQLTAVATTTKGGTYENKLMTFSSSDESIATVDADGMVTALGSGTCTITATASNGVSAECTVITAQCTEHIPEVMPAVDATCTTDGLTEGSRCSLCQAILTAQTVIPATGHSFTNYVRDPGTDCTQAGSKTAVCDHGCGTTDTIPAEAGEHTPGEAVQENIVEASCFRKGSYDSVVYCTVCSAEISRTAVETEMAEHTPVTDAYIAPTRTSYGRTEGSHCSVCGTVLQETTVLAPLADAMVIAIPRLVTSIAEETYIGSGVECVVIDDGCTEICSRAFANCANLKIIEIPASVTSIAEDAFTGSENVVIAAKPNSYAMTFALNNGIDCYITAK